MPRSTKGHLSPGSETEAQRILRLKYYYRPGRHPVNNFACIGLPNGDLAAARRAVDGGAQ